MAPTRRMVLSLAGAAASFPWLRRAARAQAQGEAQAYPTRPVRLIVGFAPAGPTDVFARLLAQKLGETLGTQCLVENIVGGNGNAATGQAAKAAPDGYTALVAFSTHIVNPMLFDKVPYHPIEDFEPVTLAVSSTTVLSVNPSVPARTVKELVDLVRAGAARYSYATGGTGSQSHLAAEQFRLSLGLELVHVPFGGGGPAVAAVVAGHAPIGFNVLTPVVPHVKQGKLRALAITGKTRSQILPEVPTMTEAGYPDIEGDSWVGILLPARTPKEIVQALHRAIVKVTAQPDMKGRVASLGFEPVVSTPDHFARQMAAETETWGKVIRAANIRVR